MNIINISGYKFFVCLDPASLQQQLLEAIDTTLKGTILLSHEGININLAGSRADIDNFRDFLLFHSLLADICLKESVSHVVPFKRLKVKIKKEIIKMGKDNIEPQRKAAPYISPAEFKQWLDENRPVTILDTRNIYEIDYGTFDHAQHLDLTDFNQFPEKIYSLPKDKPIVTFCTGGIRCEKAALELIEEGFAEVYQLDGGILNYFEKEQGAHFKGTCFVFDDRVALDSDLKPIK